MFATVRFHLIQLKSHDLHLFQTRQIVLLCTMDVKPFTEAEIQTFRAATKGTTERIHLNNANASLPPDTMVNTMVDFLQKEALYDGHETEAKYRAQLDHTHNLIAQLINAHPDEIALVENASAAWDIAFNGLHFQPGDEVITS